ncbi:MAG: hypothetical protein KDA96_21300 [Planctomycetaceae bacterium]|nr:hypothetical protein [Planctomycetaceae bacterium]
MFLFEASHRLTPSQALAVEICYSDFAGIHSQAGICVVSRFVDFVCVVCEFMFFVAKMVGRASRAKNAGYGWQEKIRVGDLALEDRSAGGTLTEALRFNAV